MRRLSPRGERADQARRSPTTTAFALSPWWMNAIRDFDAIAVLPCREFMDSEGFVEWERCSPQAADFWSVFGHYRVEGGIDWLEDFPTEAEAEAFANKLRQVYPHLSEAGEGPL